MRHFIREQTTQLKGIAIVAIALHNYFHWIFVKTKENEIDFDPARFDYFLTTFLSSPTEWAQSLFTYFGHFGVQIFIFLSAYGLMIAYPNVGTGYRFLASRIKKLYPTLIVVMLIWVVVDGLQAGIHSPLEMLAMRYVELLQLLTGIYPLIPGHKYPAVGPWWFISYIIQFYVIWILLSRLASAASNGALLTMILAGIAVNYTLLPLVIDQLQVHLLLMPLGHLPEIFLGIYYAKRGISMPWPLILFACVTLVVSGMFYAAWPLHHISALLVFLFLCIRLLEKGSTKTLAVLTWLGSYSLPIFLINGFLRQFCERKAILVDRYLHGIAIFRFCLRLRIFSCDLAQLAQKPMARKAADRVVRPREVGAHRLISGRIAIRYAIEVKDRVRGMLAIQKIRIHGPQMGTVL